MWHFDSVRDYIIRQLDPVVVNLNPFDRVDIADRCRVEKWLVPAFAQICAREAPPTAEEGSRLGLHRFTAIWRIREQKLKDDAMRAGNARFSRKARPSVGSELEGGETQSNPFKDACCGHRCAKLCPSMAERAYGQLIREAKELHLRV